MKFNIIVAIFALFAVFHGSDASSLNQPQPQFINNLLESTENLRTKNFIKFSKQVEELKYLESNFNDNQSCHYKYLYSYKVAFIGNFDLALKTLKELKTSCSKEIDALVRIEAFLANLNVISGDYEGAIIELDNLIKRLDIIRDKTTKHYVFSAAMIVYDLLNQSELSLKFAGLLINDLPSGINLCKGTVHKYISLIKLQKVVPIEKVEKSIRDCEKNNEIVFSQILNMVWINHEINNPLGDLQNLYERISQAENTIESTKFQNLIAYKNSLLSNIHYRLNNNDKAKQYAMLSLDNSKTLGDTEHKIKALDVLLSVHTKQGDLQNAFDYLTQKTAAERLHYDDLQAKNMAFQVVKHNNLAKTHQIEYLNKQNEVLQLNANLAEQAKLNHKLVILSLALVAGFLLFWGYRHKREQKIYRRLSELDHMTLIYNRKGMRDYMKYLLPYSEKKKEVVTYAIFDLDHFKKVNDDYGHITGDWVIKKTIEVCQQARNFDEKITFGRLGGEEFAIIIRDSNIQEMKEFAEHCRKNIENINTHETGFDFQIRASFGITSTLRSGYGYTDLLKDADKALYGAKNNGRNQVVVYNDND